MATRLDSVLEYWLELRLSVPPKGWPSMGFAMAKGKDHGSAFLKGSK
jgi:hypothetical protein